jgi:hypothetical protein
LLERGENINIIIINDGYQMKDEVNTEELKEAARETYRRLQNELERKIVGHSQPGAIGRHVAADGQAAAQEQRNRQVDEVDWKSVG